MEAMMDDSREAIITTPSTSVPPSLSLSLWDFCPVAVSSYHTFDHHTSTLFTFSLLHPRLFTFSTLHTASFHLSISPILHSLLSFSLSFFLSPSIPTREISAESSVRLLTCTPATPQPP